MFIRVPNTIGVEVRQLMDNQKIENTMNFQGDTAPSDEDVKDVAEFVGEWWETLIIPQLTSTNLYVETYAYSRDTELGVQWTDVPASPIPGQNIGSPMPNETALFVSFNLATRSVEGRYGNFISGIPKGECDGNYISPSWAGGISLAYNSLKNTILSTLGLVMVGVSLKVNGEWRPLGITYPITSCGMKDLLLDSQRRRKPGNGT